MTPPHVRLRSPRKADAGEFLEMARRSQGLHRPWVYPPQSPADYEDFMRRITRADTRAFLVCDAESGAIAGVFVLSQIFRGALESAYLGFYAGVDHVGKGYMSRGIQLVLRAAFRDLKLHRVEANVQPGNTASLILISRAGFRREGYSPRYLKIGGRWRDHERWAILREEWSPR